MSDEDVQPLEAGEALPQKSRKSMHSYMEVKEKYELLSVQPTVRPRRDLAVSMLAPDA